MADSDPAPIEALDDTRLTSFSIVCPRCGTACCQIDLNEPGGLNGFEAVCRGCDAALFPTTAVAVGDGAEDVRLAVLQTARIEEPVDADADERREA